MRTSYSLDQEKFQDFRSYWEGGTTTISPFHSMQRIGVTEVHKKQFNEIGLLDDYYRKTKNMDDILRILSNPSARFIISYIDDKSNFKLTVYKQAENPEICAVLSKQEDVTIFYPISASEIAGLIRDTAIIPAISSPVVPVNLSLSRTDAAVLAVLIDIQRQSLSGQVQVESSGEGIKPVTSDSYEIFEILHNYEKNPQKWLIITLFFDDIPFEKIKEENIRQSLSRLFAQGYLSRSGDGYILDPRLLSLSKNLGNPTFIVLITSMALVKNHPAREVRHNIFGGSGSILIISSQSGAEGVISMETITPESVSTIIRQMIEDPSGRPGGAPPDVPFTREAESTKSPLKGNGSVCPRCGNPLSENANFCRKCGYSLLSATGVKTAPVYQCPQCGNPVNKGAKFCRKCGKSLK